MGTGTLTDRPLHPTGDEDVFQHPIKGFVIKKDDRMLCRVNDIGRSGDPGDLGIYVGVEVFRARNELGTWLTEQHPDPKHKLLNHLFVEAIFPCDFSGDDAGSRAVLGRVDLATSVIDAGGACTVCGAQNDDGSIDHLVGCEYMSWMMYQVAKRIVDAAGEPSLAEVVQAAHEQIARMQ